jgi:hypothetical protein
VCAVRLEFVTNLKTVKALSLKKHPQLLVIADRGDRVKWQDVL